MTKRGEKVLIHGLVKDEPFTVTQLEADEDSAMCEAQIAIAPGNALYEGYPLCVHAHGALHAHGRRRAS